MQKCYPSLRHNSLLNSTTPRGGSGLVRKREARTTNTTSISPDSRQEIQTASCSQLASAVWSTGKLKRATARASFPKSQSPSCSSTKFIVGLRRPDDMKMQLYVRVTQSFALSSVLEWLIARFQPHLTVRSHNLRFALSQRAIASMDRP